MRRLGRIWTVAIVLAAALAVAGTTVAAVATATTKGSLTYSQHKYHKMVSKINEWHNCDFSVNTKIVADFAFMQSPDAQLQVTVEKVGSGSEVTILAGKLSDLGFQDVKKGVGRLLLDPGIYNYSGQSTASSKAFTLKFSAKTSKESTDYSGGNYILPIYEPIADSQTDIVLPPFKGQAYVRIYLKGPSDTTWTIYWCLINYSGHNTYLRELPIPARKGVLPSQWLKGSIPKK